MSSRAAIREYVNGSLWVLPMGSGLLALLVGYSVSLINVSPGSWLAPLAYQGTAGDARDLLSNVTSTVVTVIALVLGLTVVVLQLSSTIPRPLAAHGQLFVHQRWGRKVRRTAAITAHRELH